MYDRRIVELFMHPPGAGRMENPDAVGQCGDPECGDFVRIYLRIEGHYIIDAKFECQGCPAAIAVAALTVQLAKGRHLDEAWEITEQVILQHLPLPEDKQHCSNLGPGALHDAIVYWVVHSLKDAAQAQDGVVPRAAAGIKPQL